MGPVSSRGFLNVFDNAGHAEASKCLQMLLRHHAVVRQLMEKTFFNESQKNNHNDLRATDYKVL